MQGERGGNTTSLQEAERLHDEYRFEWRKKIKWRILDRLVNNGEFHADDLVDLEIPADCKNVIGSCIGGAVKKGLMLETDQRRATSDPAGHGRRSSVYRVNPAGLSGMRDRLDEHKRRQPPPEPTHLFDPDETTTRPGYFDAEEAA